MVFYIQCYQTVTSIDTFPVIPTTKAITWISFFYNRNTIELISVISQFPELFKIGHADHFKLIEREQLFPWNHFIGKIVMCWNSVLFGVTESLKWDLIDPWKSVKLISVHTRKRVSLKTKSIDVSRIS